MMKSKPSPYMQVLWDKPKMTSHCLLTSKVSFGLGSTIKDITAQGKEGVNSLVTTHLSLNMNRLTRGWDQICFRIVIYRLKFRFRKKLKLCQTKFFRFQTIIASCIIVAIVSNLFVIVGGSGKRWRRAFLLPWLIFYGLGVLVKMDSI